MSVGLPDRREVTFSRLISVLSHVSLTRYTLLTLIVTITNTDDYTYIQTDDLSIGYDSYVKNKSDKPCKRRFRRKYPGIRVQDSLAILRLVEK
jgi:hypothetical protein